MSAQTPGGLEEQFRLLTECVTDYAVFTLDPQGRVASWNVGAERLLGYAETEVLGQHQSLFFTPEDVAAGEPELELKQAAAAGRGAAERWQVRKGGDRFRAAVVVTALCDARGALCGFGKVLHDFTERQRAERRYRVLLENAFDGVTLVDAAGRVLDATPVTFRGLGYTPEEYLGREGLGFLHPDDAPAVRALLGRLVAQPGGRLTAQYRLRHRDGSYRWVEAVGTNLLHDPAVAAVVVNHRDVTERKEAERRKDEWLAMLAHELRGPLAPVSNAVRVLVLKGRDNPDLEQASEVIARQTRQLARIVDDLLEVTRLVRGQIRLHRERLDLARVVRATAADYRAAAEAAGLKLTADTPETPVWVDGDAMRLGQVIANLLDNAVKFRDGGDRVEVTLRADAAHGQAVLVVRDRGMGIEPELLPVLFDVFAQADRSLNRERGGLGLGLALVKGLVGLHGGEVRASSAGPGRGAEFTVLLPLVGEPAALAGLPRDAGPDGRRLRILIVEDSRDAADSLQMLLSLMGHEVRVAYTGPDGVRTAAEWLPEVIVSDIGLPGLDGYALAAELRRRPETAHVRLIAVTGYGSEEDRRRAAAAGFDAHLVKPADPDELRRLLTGTA